MKKEQIASFILNNCIIYDTKDTWLFDLRILTQSPGVGDWLGSVIANEIRSECLGIEQAKGILCTGTGGFGLAMRLSPYFGAVNFVRDTPKTRNRVGRIVEGPDLPPGFPVMLVDDLMNSGRTIDRLLEVAQEKQLVVKGIVTIVDIDYAGTRKFEAMGIPQFTLFKRQELGPTRKHPLDDELKVREPLWYHLDWNKNHVRNYVHASPTRINKRGHPVLVACGNDQSRMEAFDVETGKRVWSIQAPEHPKGITTGLTIRDEDTTGFFGTYGGSLIYSIDVITGKVKSRTKFGTAIHSTPVIDCYDRLWVMAESWNEKPGGVLGCFKHYHDGSLKQVSEFPFDEFTPTHLKLINGFHHHRIFAASNDSKVWEIDAKTMQIENIIDLPKTHVVKGWFESIKVQGQRKVLWLDDHGYAYIYDVKTKNLKSHRVMRSSHHVKPLAFHNRVIWFGNNWINCTDYNFKTLWVRQPYGVINGKIQNPNAYNIIPFTDSAGYLYHLDSTTGTFVNKHKLPGGCRQQPLTIDWRLIVPTDSEGLYCYA